ncbi:MAG TPA: glycosyltransferase [Abditibacteriaceae bacterium]
MTKLYKEPKTRRVMQVTWSLVAGGAEIYALTIASRLDKSRFSPRMCAIDQGGAIEGEVQKHGLPYFIMHRQAGIDWRLFGRMHRLLRRQQVKVLQTHHFNQLFYCAPGAKLLGIRIFHTEHDVELAKKPRLRVALRLLSHCCEKMIAIGEEIAQMYRDLGIAEDKIEIIRAGVELSDFHESREEARRELGIEENARVAVIVARLFPEKNHRLLLDAFAKAAQNHPDFHLLIAGEGTETEAIRAQIEALNLGAQVQMLGVRRDVPRLLAAADVFVLSSDREGLPIAILEAMAAARPIVATSVGNVPDVVRDGVSGRLVPPGDKEALAEAIEELLSDATRTKELGQNAREIARDYDVRHMIARYETLFTEEVTGKPTGEPGGR